MVQEFEVMDALERMSLTELVELMKRLPATALQNVSTACTTAQGAINLRSVVSIAQCPRACGSGVVFEIDECKKEFRLNCENGHGPWIITDIK